MEKKNTYDWRFKAIGGTSRVDISCGEDIRHLGQLDRKLWTVLSCPASGLEFDHKTLEIIDSDKDGKIRVGEIVSAADYLTSAIKNADLLLEGKDTIALSDFNLEDPAGKRLYDSAKQVLANLGLEKDSISLSDTADSVAIFKGTKFNGDGVITAASTDDEAQAKVIADMVATVGGVADRSGVEGVDEAHIEAFYAACSDYAAWTAAGEAEGIHPFGADTDAACGALEAMAAKVDDYFIRCNLAAFDADSAPALDVQVSSISEISSRNLTDCTDAISSYPLARISGRSTLPYDGINPAWKDAFGKLRALVLDKLFPEAESLDEASWNQAKASFSAYVAWRSSKKGAEVEPLGAARVEEILAADGKAALLALVEQDRAVKPEADNIDEVDSFLRLFKNFYRLLRNYVTMDDFYDREAKAIFQAGRLFVDQRSLDLCIRVDDMGKHGDMSKLSDEATFRSELESLEDLYTQVTGKTMEKYYRPPQGIYSEENLKMAQDIGYHTVFWSLAYVDWLNDDQPTKEQAFAKLLPRIHDGAVILLHSTSQTNAEILDELLTKWEAMGYTFGTIDELFAQQKKTS